MNAPDITQQDVMALLATPAAHGPECDRVDRIDTHISVVFLAKDRACRAGARLPQLRTDFVDSRAARASPRCRLAAEFL